MKLYNLGRTLLIQGHVHFLKRDARLCRNEDPYVVRARRPLRHQLRAGESGWTFTAGIAHGTQHTPARLLAAARPLRHPKAQAGEGALIRWGRGPDSALRLLSARVPQFWAAESPGTVPRLALAEFSFTYRRVSRWTQKGPATCLRMPSLPRDRDFTAPGPQSFRRPQARCRDPSGQTAGNQAAHRCADKQNVRRARAHRNVTQPLKGTRRCVRR